VCGVNGEIEKTLQLVDIEEEEDSSSCRFGGLKVGFTPGVDGRSRRVQVCNL